MRVYFIFDIKEEYRYKYKDNNLFNILRSIYNLNNSNYDYAYNIFIMLSGTIEKLRMR